MSRLSPLLALVFGLSCADGAAVSAPPVAPVAEPAADRVVLSRASGGEISVRVEVADEDAERIQGLMFRTELAGDAGMLFVYQDESPRSFWMKNTYVPLDMIFAAADGTVVSIIENARPLTTDARPSGGPAMYVLEVNAHFVSRHGIKPGDHLQWMR